MHTANSNTTAASTGGASGLKNAIYIGSRPVVRLNVKIGRQMVFTTFQRWVEKAVSSEIAAALVKRSDFIVGDYPLKRVFNEHGSGRVKLRRHGALGDIIVLYPAIRALKKVLPYTFTLACCAKYHSLFKGDSTFDEVIATGERGKLPVIGEVLLDGVLERDLGNPVERWLMPRVTAYYEFLSHGFNVLAATRFDYSLQPGEQDKAWAERLMQAVRQKGGDRPTVFVQARGSGPVRSIGRDRMQEVTRKLSDRYNVVVTDHNKDYCWSDETRGIFSAPGQRPWLNFVALMKECSVALTTDSGVQWLAHVAEIPLVSMLGPTRASEKLTTHLLYPRQVQGIDTAGLLGCTPCFENAVRCKWQYDCLNKLDIDVLWREIDKAINEVITDGNR